MNPVKLIITDGIDTQPLFVNKQILSNKSDYFKTLFNRFKESTMDEIVVNVPNTKISINIIQKLLMEYIPVDKLMIECYDYFSLNYDELLEQITNVDDIIDIVDKYGYTDNRLKIIAKKLPLVRWP